MRNDIFCNALWSDKKPIDGALKGFFPARLPWCHFTLRGLLRPLRNILFTRHNPDGAMKFFFHRLLEVAIWKHPIQVGVMFCKITDWFLWSYCTSAGEIGNWGNWMIFFFFPQTKQGNEHPVELNKHLTDSCAVCLRKAPKYQWRRFELHGGDLQLCWKRPPWDHWSQTDTRCSYKNVFLEQKGIKSFILLQRILVKVIPMD